MMQQDDKQSLTPDEAVMVHALAWHAALSDQDADWDGFTRWLESDPTHAKAFDAVALVDALVEEGKAAGVTSEPSISELREPANDRAPAGWRRVMPWGAGAGFIAAALALAIVFIKPAPSNGSQVFETKAGETRTIALDDASTVILAPASRLSVRRDDPNQISLSGSGVFNIAHRVDRRMTVRAGSFLVTDIGTRFSVDSDANAVRIAVEEGQVLVSNATSPKPIPLSAGRALRYVAGNDSIELTTIANREFASWQKGSLVYQDTPLAIVAGDIARYSGHRLTLGPGVSDLRFSGALGIGDGSKLADDLARLMDLSIIRQGETARLFLQSSR